MAAETSGVLVAAVMNAFLVAAETTDALVAAELTRAPLRSGAVWAACLCHLGVVWSLHSEHLLDLIEVCLAGDGSSSILSSC